MDIVKDEFLDLNGDGVNDFRRVTEFQNLSGTFWEVEVLATRGRDHAGSLAREMLRYPPDLLAISGEPEIAFTAENLLQVINKKGKDQFDMEDEVFLRGLASQVGIALDNSLLVVK
jgi:hypothetical protein